MKNKYTCPMHPEVVSDTPGTCPKCHMKLVLASSISSSVHKDEKNNYTPLLVVISLILLMTGSLSLKDSLMGTFSLSQTITYFMIGFFFVFSGFKFMDLKGFAEGYSTYDLIAKKWYAYGYIYPFIELIFAISMIFFAESMLLLSVEFIVMLVSGLGVLIKIMKKEKFQCACLGTFLKVPLTKVTLVEDFGMAFLALLMIVLS